MNNLISYVGVFNDAKSLSRLQVLFYDELHVINQAKYHGSQSHFTDKDLETLKESELLKYVSVPTIDEIKLLEKDHPKLFKNYANALSELKCIEQQRNVIYRRSILGKNKIGFSFSDELLNDAYTIDPSISNRSRSNPFFSSNEIKYQQKLEEADYKLVNLRDFIDRRRILISTDAYAVINGGDDRKIYLPNFSHNFKCEYSKFINGYVLDIINIAIPALTVRDLISFKYDNQDKLIRLRLAINELTHTHGDFKHAVMQLNQALYEYNRCVDNLKTKNVNQRTRESPDNCFYFQFSRHAWCYLI